MVVVMLVVSVLLVTATLSIIVTGGLKTQRSFGNKLGLSSHPMAMDMPASEEASKALSTSDWGILGASSAAAHSSATVCPSVPLA
jgi:hypothetical protein